ncbi:terminase large subunit domain-containing protein [Treponema pedis]|uniref:terminase large subunit domain-containing protein n=1 Tax=Treponema pedis TaxID=409322 RepID=UPI0031432F9F
MNEELLLPYQRTWLKDKSKLRLWEKSRRIGASFVLALEAVLNGMSESGVNTYYLSYNKDMTRQFIKDAAYWCSMLQIAAEMFEEVIVGDDRKDITVFRIRLASGKEIAALPSVEYSLRSKQGNVILDEAAFVDEFDGIKKAALALLIWGGSFSILSTHNGEDNPFNLFIKKIERGEEKHWSFHRTTFDDAVKQGLYKKICESQKLAWSKEKEKEFVLSVYEIYKDNADEELRCIPNRAGTRYFPRILLDACIDECISVARKTFDDNFLNERKSKKEKEVLKFFNSEILETIRLIEEPAFFGFDFGRSGDLSVIWLGERCGFDLMTRLIVELRNCPFDEQYQLLTLILNNLKNLQGGKCDARGNGQMLAEKLELDYPGIVEQVMISNAWYARIMPLLKSGFEEKTFTVPSDEFVLSDFGVVQVIKGIAKIAERTNEGGKKTQRHGDGAVAAALMFDAALEENENAAPFVAEVSSSEMNGNFWRDY